MAGFCHRDCPLQSTQGRVPLPPSARPPSARLCPDLEFLLLSCGKHTQLQHNHPSIIEGESLRASLCPPFILNLLAHNSRCFWGVQLPSQSCYRLSVIAFASSNLLLLPLPTSPQWSDQISLYQIHVHNTKFPQIVSFYHICFLFILYLLIHNLSAETLERFRQVLTLIT